MLDSTMRKKLRGLYGDYIHGVPISKMSREQVYMIYMNCKARGKFDKPKKLKKNQVGYQWTIEDYI